MKKTSNNFTEKRFEMKYHDAFTEAHGCYERYPDAEYVRVLSESGILNEKPSLVLDVGCGSGAFGFRLAKLGFSVVGIDISPLSIKAATRLARKQGLNADFVVGDIEMMPFRNESFPLIFCGCVLHHLPDKISCIMSGINCILKYDGRLFLCEPNALNPGCFVNYHFGKNRTVNERALNPKNILDILSSESFSHIVLADIGDIQTFSLDEVGILRGSIRRVLSLLLNMINKLPFVPGPYFVISATKRTCHGTAS